MSSVDGDSIDEEELQLLYTWVDEIPLTRPKKNISRDFSDGVLMAEVIKHFYPKLVQIHNYSAASSVTQKLYNWNTLSRFCTNFFLNIQILTVSIEKVFKRMNFSITKEEIDEIVKCTPGVIEKILRKIQLKIQELQQLHIDPQVVTPKAKATPPTVPLPAKQQQQQQPPSQQPKSTTNPSNSKSKQPLHYDYNDDHVFDSPSHAAYTSAINDKLNHIRMPQAGTLEDKLVERDQKINELNETIRVCIFINF